MFRNELKNVKVELITSLLKGSPPKLDYRCLSSKEVGLPRKVEKEKEGGRTRNNT